MKEFIINADDFGFSKEVTDGIVYAHTHGVVTSTTLMANMDAWEHAASLVGKHPGLSVGIHLTLTVGRPVLPSERVPSLVGPDGRFRPFDQVLGKAWRFRMKLAEIESELSAQMERLLAAGVRPTHADSHHHITMYPQTFLAVMRVLKRYDIRRMRTHRGRFVPDSAMAGRAEVRRLCRSKRMKDAPKQAYYTVCDAWIRAARSVRTPRQRYGFYRVVSDHPLECNHDDWRRLLLSAPCGVSEVVAHPGFRHEHPADDPEMRAQRVRELEFFTDPQTRWAMDAAGVKLTNFREV